MLHTIKFLKCYLIADKEMQVRTLHEESLQVSELGIACFTVQKTGIINSMFINLRLIRPWAL